MMINSVGLMQIAVVADSYSAKNLQGVNGMFKELTIAIALTVIFSIGVGVLFVRTLVEMLELFFNGEIDKNEPVASKGRNK